MPAERVRHLPGWEDDVYLWIEQESSIMLKASTSRPGNPVELSAADARRLARMLEEAADELDRMP